jgi:hypothetical protein
LAEPKPAASTVFALRGEEGNVLLPYNLTCMKKRSPASWLAFVILSAAAFATSCQNTNVKTTGKTQVTQMEYAAMTPEARAKGNFEVIDNHPLPGKGPENSAIIFETPIAQAGDKFKQTGDTFKESRDISYEDLNKARAQ